MTRSHSPSRRDGADCSAGDHSAPARIAATFDGAPLEAPAGCSVAAALLASGRPAWRTTRDGEQRGVFCGIGVCFDCLVQIDGESSQRACMIPLQPGMDVRSAVGPAREHPSSEANAGPEIDGDEMADGTDEAAGGDASTSAGGAFDAAPGALA